MAGDTKLSLGVILPHTKIFGGVKRFFEIGNVLIGKGHSFTVFTPDGEQPSWFDFRGNVVKLEAISAYDLDGLFITEPEFLPQLRTARTRIKFFYAVLERSYIKKVVREKDIIVLANSTRLYRYLGGAARPNVFKATGGIDTQKFALKNTKLHRAGDPFTVLAYGRFYRKKKGTMLVVRACEKLYKKGYNLKLILFDSPVDEQARKQVEKFSAKLPFQFYVDHPVKEVAALYYQANVFVSAERNAGWSNTSAEAMACGVPVIATRSGTEDFLLPNETGLLVWRHPWFIQRAIKRLYHDANLREQLAANARKKIEEFSWSNLANTIEKMVTDFL